MPIHPTAIVSPEAEIHETAEIGPYVVVEGPVRIGARTWVGPSAHVSGDTEIGEDNRIHMGAVLGYEPQDLGYKGERRNLKIGDRNNIREHVTIHASSSPERTTSIGDDCFLMATAHVAHDCTVGDRVILVNGVLIAGHCTIEDCANISGNAAVHQFTRIGAYAMVQGMSVVVKDVPPYTIHSGRNRLAGVNAIGLKRAGFSPEARREIRSLYKMLFREGRALSRSLEVARAETFGPEAMRMLAFIEGSKRGVCCRTLREEI